jgi:hypothetical protein
VILLMVVVEYMLFCFHCVFGLHVWHSQNLLSGYCIFLQGSPAFEDLEKLTVF